MDERKLREDLAFFGRRILESGLAVGPGGNISVRCGEKMLISPSGLSFEEVAPEGYVAVNLATGEVEGKGRPSSEVAMHRAIYRTRSDVQAVVHVHPPFVIGVASGGGEIQPMFPDFVALLPRVVTLPYILPCTEELAQAVGEAVRNAEAIVLVNHGAITVGATLKEAFYRAQVLEEGAKILTIARLFGNPRILSMQEQEALLALDAERYRQRVLKEA
ncbi:class II aldolase/adducin family protein [Candidatus Caldatribacterium sp.]|uniref:class II aldolase/adducin family protein n=1 Tax=Candidatus Caldatribacterium sp. TaxID=2282143 RepID=UPI0029954151|nr:class II aldolase/adducin family protein [Candidatus Caldatribacterium sp.]MDW8081293.1 class II aldolase/adducin family protein [Candidatus Calescibacterium sp.]